MHVFIAGGAGYIGSVLIPSLLEQGHRVTVVDRLYFGDTLSTHRERWPDRLEVVRGDVRSFSPALLEGVAAVVSMAAISNDPAAELEPDLTQRVNVEGGQRLAQLALDAGVRRLVFLSSCSIYGTGTSLALTEESELRPVSLYAAAMAQSEAGLRELAAASAGAFEPVILRLATVFGVSPRMRFDLAVNVMAKDAYIDRRITVDGGGRQWRPFVHVRDVGRAIVLGLSADAATVAGETFNIGSDENNLQILTLALRVRDEVPGTQVVHAFTDPELRDYNVSFDKARTVLGFLPAIEIEDGVRDVLAALRSGQLDPDDRRWYTLRQYLFLREAERAVAELALDGGVLSVA